MKKNILIIGFGDIAKRLTNNLNKDLYNIYGVSRQDKENKNFIKWDWLSRELPSLDNISGLGPIKTILFSKHSFANSGLSDKNP